MRAKAYDVIVGILAYIKRERIPARRPILVLAFRAVADRYPELLDIPFGSKFGSIVYSEVVDVVISGLTMGNLLSPRGQMDLKYEYEITSHLRPHYEGAVQPRLRAAGVTAEDLTAAAAVFEADLDTKHSTWDFITHR
jgi:hypothetical protein